LMKTFSSHLISTQSVAFWYTDFYTTLYFFKQRDYETFAVPAHTQTCTRYFYNLNAIISLPIVRRKDWVISPCVCYRFAVFPSLPCIYL
jgi:hypothetical protein